jgi:hypothetical protein
MVATGYESVHWRAAGCADVTVNDRFKERVEPWLEEPEVRIKEFCANPKLANNNNISVIRDIVNIGRRTCPMVIAGSFDVMLSIHFSWLDELVYRSFKFLHQSLALTRNYSRDTGPASQRLSRELFT